MKIFFSAGEPSGDLHGANLIRELRSRRPDLQAVGFGGPEMATAGCDLHADLTSLAVMWFLRAILNLHKFLHLASRADRYFRHQRPDAVVLIDFPGFHWWIARRAKAHDIPVFYYAPPQIWAWGSWRVKKMRRFVDHVLASLPFEARWLAERGCKATFVGHPFFDEVARQQLDADFVASHRDAARPLVLILPGSRNQEVAHNLTDLLRAAKLVQAAVPTARFAIGAFKPQHAETATKQVAACGLAAEVFVRRTPELIELADCCLAVSGSVSLELLNRAKPTVILYKISPLAHKVQSWFRHVRYITLVNLLAAKDIFFPPRPTNDQLATIALEALFPEYLTCVDRSREIAAHLIGWLTDREQRAKLVQRLEALRDEVGQSGAAGRAAAILLADVEARHPLAPRTHYSPGWTPAGEAHRRECRQAA
jgi:lipid-A-disaccharide synthase